MIPLAATIIYVAMSFNPGSPMEPLIWTRPLTHAECLRFERETSGTWCQPIRVRK